MTPKKWAEGTGAVGVVSKSGKYGGTYAHKDIAFEFGTWISPEFKLLLIKEFQNLKDEEKVGQIWDYRRFLTKANYRVQTDAIKDVLIPFKNIPKGKENFVYASEADLLYVAMYGYTSKEWRDSHPDLVAQGGNLRDFADTHQLIVLNSLETLNAEFIRNNVSEKDRLVLLRRAAIAQLKSIKKSVQIEDTKIESPNKEAKKQIWSADPIAISKLPLPQNPNMSKKKTSRDDS